MTIHPQDVHKLRAQIAGWLAVEPNRHIADSIDVPFFIDANGRRPAELVAVPVPAPADGLKTPSQARDGLAFQSERFAASSAVASFVT
jgi:hypothetical protein